MIAPLCVRTMEDAEAYIGKEPRVRGSHSAAPGSDRACHIQGELSPDGRTSARAPPSDVAAAEISQPWLLLFMV